MVVIPWTSSQLLPACRPPPAPRGGALYRRVRLECPLWQLALGGHGEMVENHRVRSSWDLLIDH